MKILNSNRTVGSLQPAKICGIGKIALLLCLFLLWCPSQAFAVGEGDGGGGGPAIPLLMDWCYPANGEVGVSITPVIQCKYSHNVAQGLVKKRNLTLLSLKEKSGAAVETEVFAADAQLEFDKRQYLYLRPLKPLKPNTTYVVTAKEGLQAKNGMVTEADQSFLFVTCGATGDFNASGVKSMVAEAEAAALASGGQVEATTKQPLQEQEQLSKAKAEATPSLAKTEAAATKTKTETKTKPVAVTPKIALSSTGFLLGALLLLLMISLGVKAWWLWQQNKIN